MCASPRRGAVAAYEVLGTPDKRAVFDEAARGGADSYAHFEARWQQKAYEFDSDLYAGAKYVTTLTEKLWARRLVGETVWLVEAYAAWCPACRGFVNTWQATGALMRDDDALVLAETPVRRRLSPATPPRPTLGRRALRGCLLPASGPLPRMGTCESV